MIVAAQKAIIMTKILAHVNNVIINVNRVPDLPTIVQNVQEPKEKAQQTENVHAQSHIMMMDKTLNVLNVLINVQFVIQTDVLNVLKTE